jgi:regulator of nucleoside diphosphate kinase
METIYLTDKDYQRLHQVVQVQRRSSGPLVVEALSRELKRAQVVPSQQIPADVITMNSLVRLKDLKSDLTMDVAIVYPKDANMNTKKVSVLAPVGTAVLGCKVGDKVKCAMGKGTATYLIEGVLYQPEAAGDFNL